SPSSDSRAPHNQFTQCRLSLLFCHCSATISCNPIVGRRSKCQSPHQKLVFGGRPVSLNREGSPVQHSGGEPSLARLLNQADPVKSGSVFLLLSAACGAVSRKRVAGMARLGLDETPWDGRNTHVGRRAAPW